MRLSASSIKMYLRCPRQYRYAYIDEIPAVLTGPLVFGRVIHEVLHNLEVERMQHPGNVTPECVENEFQRLWQQALVQDRPWFKDGETTLAAYEKLAPQILSGYLARLQDRPPPFVMEYPFELAWGEHQLSGVIDRIEEVDGALIVVDFKTGQRKPSPHELGEDLQLTIYALAAQVVFELPVLQLVYYHLRDHTALATERGEEDFYQLQTDVLPRVTTAIAEGQFPKRPGYWCRFCDYRELCLAESQVHP